MALKLSKEEIEEAKKAVPEPSPFKLSAEEIEEAKAAVPDVKEPSALDKAETLLRGGISGLTFGLADPVVAGAEALIRKGVEKLPIGPSEEEMIAAGLEPTPEPSLGELYSQAQARYAGMKEELPGYDIAGQLAGGFSPVGPAAAAFKAVKGAAKAVPVLGKSAVARGALEGGLYAAGTAGARQAVQGVTGYEGEPEAPLMEQIQSGALVGGAFPAAGAVLKGAKNLAKKTAIALTRVKEDDIVYYLQNRDRIKSAKTLEEVKEVFDDSISKIRSQVDDATLNKQQADDLLSEFTSELKQKYKEKGIDASMDARAAKMELDAAHRAQMQVVRETKAPVYLADELRGLTEQTKKDLIEKSNASYDILEKSKNKIKTSTLINRIKAAKKDLEIEGVLSTPDDEKMAKTLTWYEEQFGKLPKSISMSSAKDLLKRLDKAIDWDYGNADFNPEVNRVLKDLRATIRSELPKEYQEFMAKEVAPLAQLHSKAVEYFKDPRQGAAKIASIHLPSNKDVIDTISQLQVKTKTPMVPLINEYLQMKGISGAQSVQDRLRQSLPEYQDYLRTSKRLEEIQAMNVPEMIEKQVAASRQQAMAQAAALKLEEAKKSLEPFKTWNEMTSWQKLQSFNRQNANPEVIKRIKMLSGMSEQDFVTMIKDAHAANVFLKGGSESSRSVNWLAVIGGAGTALATGDPTAGVVGLSLGAFGPLVDKYGGRVVQKVLDASADIKGLPTVQKWNNLLKDKLPPEVRQEIIDSFVRASANLGSNGDTNFIPEEMRGQVGSEIKNSDALSDVEKARLMISLVKRGEIDSQAFKKIIVGKEKVEPEMKVNPSMEQLLRKKPQPVDLNKATDFIKGKRAEEY